MRWLLSQLTPCPRAGAQGAENSVLPLPPALSPEATHPGTAKTQQQEPAGAAGQLGQAQPCPQRRWKKHSLPGTQLDGEGAAAGVHLEGGGLAAGRRPAAVLAVDEELPDLLGHRDVVHHHRQLGVVHGALLCQGREGWTRSERVEMGHERF